MSSYKKQNKQSPTRKKVYTEKKTLNQSSIPSKAAKLNSVWFFTSFKRPPFYPELREGWPGVVEERISHREHVEATEQEKHRVA